MKIYKMLGIVGVAALLGGCAGFVETSSTSFHGPEHINRGSVAVLPIDKTQEDSLEFRAVSEYLAKKLVEKGYVEAATGTKSQYSAFITYGIDSGTTTVSTLPIYGQTGGGTTYSSGTVSGYGQISNFSGMTTTMPTYGMIGAVPVRSTQYKRRVNIDIWRNEPKPVKVYEIRGLSSGSCGNISGILRNIIDGIFVNFPGENGRSKSVNTSWNGNC
jgi:hypothetical protein